LNGEWLEIGLKLLLDQRSRKKLMKHECLTTLLLLPSLLLLLLLALALALALKLLLLALFRVFLLLLFRVFRVFLLPQRLLLLRQERQAETASVAPSVLVDMVAVVASCTAVPKRFPLGKPREPHLVVSKRELVLE
jgi:hypothetical protein